MDEANGVMSEPEEYPEVLEGNEEGLYEFNKEEIFSHSAMTSIAYRNCVASGSVEMIKGFWETKRDKYGNELRNYHPDTRQVFINSVETLKRVLISDFDDEARRNIGILNLSVTNLKHELLNAEHEWFTNLPLASKTKFQHSKGFFNQDGMFYNNLINTKVEIYGIMFEQLELLLKRTKYLKKKVFVNFAG